ncbi:MAG: hypothetical protein Ta2E_08090 [Mycoplasmoidaceae bacterium]|nr:MAG: hypothetical protein Ta2E_08090 [Mycoplasmoidaceae bacterium]
MLSNIYKRLPILICLGFGVAIPFIATSCASAKYYSVPMKVGSLNLKGTKSPWRGVDANGTDIIDSSNNLDLSWESGVTKKNFDEYIPSQYIVNAPKGTWAWSQPEKIENDTVIGDSTYSWNLPTLTSLSNDSGSNRTVLSYRNANLTGAINSVASISTTLSSYYKLIMSYLTQPGLAFNKNQTTVDNWMKALLSNNFDWNNEKDKFYNFAFSNVNTMAETGRTYQFGISDVDFTYASSSFGPGHLLSRSLATGFSYDDGSGVMVNDIPYANLLFSNWRMDKILHNDVYGGTSNIYISNLENEILPTDGTITDSTRQFKVGGYDVGASKGYSSPYVTLLTENENDNGKLTSAFIKQIPTVVKANSVNYSYFNFKKNSGFNPNDWTISKDEVNKTIKNAPSWSKYKSIVGSNQVLDNNTCEVKTPSNPVSDFVWPTYSPIINPSDTANSYYLDPVTLSLFGNPSSPTLSQNDFITFGTYSCSVDNISIPGATILQPYSLGTTYAFPVWLLQKYDENNNIAFDYDMLSFYTDANAPTSGYGSRYKYYATINPEALNQKFNNTILNFFTTGIGQNEQPKTQNKYSMDFAKYMLSDISGTTTPLSFLKW